MQRQLSSFDIYVIVSELQHLKDCQIDKIYQLTRDELLIKVRNIKTKEKEQIFIRNGNIISVTDKQFETPLKPTTFTMTLRKYLLNGRITNVSQHEFDRIIEIGIGKKEGKYTLVVEFFSDGNIILVDPNGNIILPLIRQSWKHRKVKGKEPYVSPPPQTIPFELNRGKFIELLKGSNADVVRTLAVNLSLSGPIAEEICLRANVDKNLDIKDLSEGDISNLYDAFVDFIDVFKNKKFKPVIVKKNGEIFDILPFKFESYKDFDFEEIESIVRGLENFTEVKKVERKIESQTEKLLGKLNRQLIQQEETVEKLKIQIDEKKIEGDLIYLNYQDVEQVLDEIRKVLDLKEKDEAIRAVNEKDVVKVFNPSNNLLVLNLKNTSGQVFEVKINFRKTVAGNAEKAYDNQKKLRGKHGGAEKSIKKTKEDIEKILKKVEVEKKQEEERVVKKERLFWFERFRWFISSDGNVVIGGKDAKTNEVVVKKYLKEGDRYAHADIQGAPSIIVKSLGVAGEKTSVSDSTLEEACSFAASFSKAWKQFAEAQAYWVNPEQVSKTAESGEFVPKGAFIIRGKRNYYRCKLEVAVGEVELDGEKKIMGGPIGAVKKWSKRFVVVVPGDTKKSDIAGKLGKSFNVSVDKVDRVLPPGGCSIAEVSGLKLE